MAMAELDQLVAELFWGQQASLVPLDPLQHLLVDNVRGMTLDAVWSCWMIASIWLQASCTCAMLCATQLHTQQVDHKHELSH